MRLTSLSASRMPPEFLVVAPIDMKSKLSRRAASHQRLGESRSRRIRNRLRLELLEDRRLLAGDAGAEELNGALSLRLYALDLEIQGEQWQAALQRVDAARAETKRPERWWVRRGDILRRCQRWEEARQAYQEALLALDRLSGLRRRVPAMLELRQQAELGLTLVLSSVGDSKPKE